MTHKGWLAKGFRGITRHGVPIDVFQDWGFDIDPKKALETIWWAPGAWVASAYKAGVRLPLTSCGPYWLERLPMEYRGRGVKTMTLAESIRRMPDQAEWDVFVKLPEAKLEHFPAAVHKRNRHWEATMAQYHLPDDALIQLQDVRKFWIEYRFWIAYGEIKAHSLYQFSPARWSNKEPMPEPVWWGQPEFPSAVEAHGRFNNALNACADTVERLLADERVKYPRGFVLDVGIAGDADPVVIEANAAWSSGPYDGQVNGIYETIVASHDFNREFPEWAWDPNPALYRKAAPLKCMTP